MIRTKAVRRITAALFLAGLLTSGCGRQASPFPPEQNAIYADGGGRLYTALLREYDESAGYYSQDELLERVQEEVDGYNAGTGVQGEVPVTVEEVSLSEGRARVVLSYSDASHLLAFTQASQDTVNHPLALDVATVKEGLAGDGAADAGWYDAGKKEQISPEEVLRRPSLNFISVTGDVTVQTESPILYYSGDVALADEYTARVAGGSACIVYR